MAAADASPTVSLQQLAAKSDEKRLEAHYQETIWAQKFGDERHCTLDSSEPSGANFAGIPQRQTVFACLKCSSGGENPFGFCYACSMRCHLHCSLEKQPEVARETAGNASLLLDELSNPLPAEEGESAVIELFKKRDFMCDCGTPRSRAGLSMEDAERSGIVSFCEFEREGVLANSNNAGAAGKRTLGDASSVSAAKVATVAAAAAVAVADRSSDHATNVYGQNFKGRYCSCGGPYDAASDESMFQCVLCEDWFHGKCLLAESNGGEAAALPGPPERCDLTCQECAKKLAPVLARNRHLRFFLGEPLGQSPGSAADVIHARRFSQFWFDPVRSDSDSTSSGGHHLRSSTLLARASETPADGGDVAFMDYEEEKTEGKRVVSLLHVFVPVAMRSRGIGTRFGRAVLRWLRLQSECFSGQTHVRLVCSFLHKALHGDPEFADLLLLDGEKARMAPTVPGCVRDPRSADAAPLAQQTHCWWQKKWRTRLCACDACGSEYAQLGFDFLVRLAHERDSDDEQAADSDADSDVDADVLAEREFGKMMSLSVSFCCLLSLRQFANREFSRLFCCCCCLFFSCCCFGCVRCYDAAREGRRPAGDEHCLRLPELWQRVQAVLLRAAPTTRRHDQRRTVCRDAGGRRGLPCLGGAGTSDWR
jgi:GCN5-related N-acetyl-transferase